MSDAAAIDTTAGPMAGMGELNGRVAITLRVGVLVSALLFATAIIARAATGGVGLLTASPGLDPSAVGDAIVHPSALGLALLGAIVLAATPLVRVVLSFEFFAARRDRAFTALTLFVLVVLLTTVTVGVLR